MKAPGIWHAAMLAAVLLVTGCPPRHFEAKDKLYFDLTGYLNTEMERLIDTCVTKAVQIDDSVQTKLIEHTDTAFWRQEFALFFDADINAPAYRELYSITRAAEGLDSVITYESTTPKTPTRWLKVWKQGADVVRIEVSQVTQNIVYSMEHNLVYTPKSGYFIGSIQKTRGTPEREFVIDGRMGCTPFVSFQF